MAEKRILIIDDDPDIRSYFAKFFRVLDSNIKLHEASTLVSAVDLLERESVSLILLDLRLEYEMGVEFLKFREDMAKIKKIPVVVISAHSEEEMVRECLQYGIKDFIKKPFEGFEQLKKRLEKISSFSRLT
ncbi:MAG: response regulator [Deltaproteobacteria bacterium]|nr:MAG: response regulator [Deltaproteobacteria bacterium]